MYFPSCFVHYYINCFPDCYRLRFSGYKHLFAGSASSASSSVDDCARACAESGCGSFSFSLGTASLGSSCITSSLAGAVLRPESDLRRDPDWDVYEFENRCV